MSVRYTDVTAMLWLPFEAQRALTASLKQRLGGELGALDLRRFPDGEALVRLGSEVRDRDVALVVSLDHPDDKLLPLLFAAATARELGARSVGLVAPYLAYLRQDRRFHPGEAISARLFARVLARPLDWLVTVEPHLHRIHDLSQIYPIPAIAVHAAPALADWVASNVPRPLLIGPDEESGPWVEAVAARAAAPWVVGRKTRTGDRRVAVELPDNIARYTDVMPVLIDDVISTGRTLAMTARALVAAGLPAPVVAAVHGLFTPDALPAMREAGITKIATCNSMLHETATIDVAPLLADAIRSLAQHPGQAGGSATQKMAPRGSPA